MQYWSTILTNQLAETKLSTLLCIDWKLWIFTRDFLLCMEENYGSDTCFTFSEQIVSYNWVCVFFQEPILGRKLSSTCFISINSFVKYGIISDKSILFFNCEMVPCQNSFSFSYFFCLNRRSFWRTCNGRWRLVSAWQPCIHRSNILTSTEL